MAAAFFEAWLIWMRVIVRLHFNRATVADSFGKQIRVYLPTFPADCVRKVVSGVVMVLFATLAKSDSSAATAVVFANGNQFAPGSIDTTRVNAMRSSGFNTVILFTLTIDASGNFTYDDGVPVCSNCVYTGGANWATKLAQCKAAPTAVSRIEMSIAGWGDPSFANIRNRILADGLVWIHQTELEIET